MYTSGGTRRAWSLLVPLLSLALMMAVSPPAGAGTEDDPEITDFCGGPDEHDPWADICSGWFEGIWSPVSEVGSETVGWRLDGFQSTLRLAGGVADRPRVISYGVSWRLAECTQGWYTRDSLNSDEVGRWFFQNCSGDIIIVDLPEQEVQLGQDRVVATLDLQGTLKRFSDVLKEGSVISGPWAYVLVDPRLSEPSHPQATLEWDGTERGRSFTLGQDRPPPT